MARRSRRRGFDPLIDGLRLAFVVIMLLALATGDIREFPRRLLGIPSFPSVKTASEASAFIRAIRGEVCHSDSLLLRSSRASLATALSREP